MPLLYQVPELKLRAERRLGELLKETVEHEGGKVAALSNNLLPEGVSRMQSSRWQRRPFLFLKLSAASIQGLGQKPKPCTPTPIGRWAWASP